jgi:hypothetical protein
VLAYGLSHVKTPRAAEKDEDSVAHVQQPEYLSSMRTLPCATVPPVTSHVMLKVSPREKIKVEPGAGDVTLSTPPDMDSTGVVATTEASARDAQRAVYEPLASDASSRNVA